MKQSSFYSQTQNKRVLSLFLELVQIDSLTYNEEAVLNYLKQFCQRLNISYQTDKAGEKIGGKANNLIMYLPGAKKATPIFFSCHLDTVAPGQGIEPLVKDGVISSKGETILGADDKAGVAVLLRLAEEVAANPNKFGPIEIVFTVAEEKGLLGSKNLDYSLVKAKFGFVFDAAEPVGHITTRAPYHDSFTATFIGQASHAGVSPEKGVNAIVAAAKAISKMKLGRIDRETTANIGVIEGGRATNIVPEKVVIKGEARSLVLPKLKSQIAQMQKAVEQAAAEVGAKVEVEVNREYNGFSLNKTHQAVKIAQTAMKALGLEPVCVATGGGSDVNIFNAKGKEAVNLGVGYKDPHTTNETIAVAQLVKAAELAVEIAKVAAGF